MIAAEPVLASSLLNEQQEKAAPATGNLSTGCKAIDTVLKGNLEPGSITCFSSESDAGVRDITQSLIISHLLGTEDAVVTVIDTGQALDVNRLYHAISTASSERSGASAKAFAKATLDRVKLMKTFDFEGLTDGLSELRDALDGRLPAHERPPRGTVPDSQADQDEMLDTPTSFPLQQMSATETPATLPGRSGGLLILDSITQLAAPLLKANQPSGQALITSSMRSLAHLTKANALCTVVVNGTVSTKGQNYREDSPSAFSSCAVRPALGKTWTRLVDVHLLLHQMPKSGQDAKVLYGGQHVDSGSEMVNVMEVLQDRRGDRVGRWAAFEVDGDGRLKDVL